MPPNQTAGLMPFQAMEILSQAKALEAQGHSICHLELGEPNAMLAPSVLLAATQALQEPQRYTHAKGRQDLRERLAGYYLDQHGVAINPESILITMGSSAGFILSFHAAFAPGATIAVTRPGYPAYLNTLMGLGFNAVEIPLSAQNGWRLTGAAIAAAHRNSPFEGLLFASPANPTGAALDREGLADIVETCKRLGVRLISDEIYHGLDFREPSVSALELTADAIVINSFSKYYCMTGWRIGWMVVPDDILRRAEILQQNFFISASSLSQAAALAALDERDYCEAQKAVYAGNRDCLTAGLNRIGMAVAPADGAFYAYADVSRFTNDSLSFCKALLADAGVAATPGVDFDRVNGQNFVRFSFAGGQQTVETALDRISGFLSR